MEKFHGFAWTEFLCCRLGFKREIMTSFEPIVPADAGERLRIARESAKITQASAAKAIGVARTTIIAIEQGERRARMDLSSPDLAWTEDRSITKGY
jgi:DNA-binding XRE family transcriptional regulator